MDSCLNTRPCLIKYSRSDQPDSAAIAYIPFFFFYKNLCKMLYKKSHTRHHRTSLLHPHQQTRTLTFKMTNILKCSSRINGIMFFALCCIQEDKSTYNLPLWREPSACLKIRGLVRLLFKKNIISFPASCQKVTVVHLMALGVVACRLQSDGKRAALRPMCQLFQLRLLSIYTAADGS